MPRMHHPKDTRKGFIVVDSRHGLCGHLHGSIREAVSCNDALFKAAEAVDETFDGWPCRAELATIDGREVLAYEAKAALDAIVADPALNGRPGRDHAADEAEVRASVPPARLAELEADALRGFPKTARVRRAVRRPRATRTAGVA